ncbi:MAG: Hsp20 family protein [Bacteroidetes bacterium]|nr:Hsp20 family protein [Bacteroidota bacterium]
MTRLLTRTPQFRPRTRLSNELFDSPRESESTVWSPTLDIVETNTGYHIALDLPGLSREHVTLTFEDSILKISGERTLPQQDTDPQYHRLERWQGRFFRRLRFGVGINPDGIEARFTDGVLNVFVPKAEERKPRRIAIE